MPNTSNPQIITLYTLWPNLMIFVSSDVTLGHASPPPPGANQLRLNNSSDRVDNCIRIESHTSLISLYYPLLSRCYQFRSDSSTHVVRCLLFTPTYHINYTYLPFLLPSLIKTSCWGYNIDWNMNDNFWNLFIISCSLFQKLYLFSYNAMVPHPKTWAIRVLAKRQIWIMHWKLLIYSYTSHYLTCNSSYFTKTTFVFNQFTY
jgi:hypothetical protein